MSFTPTILASSSHTNSSITQFTAATTAAIAANNLVLVEVTVLVGSGAPPTVEWISDGINTYQRATSKQSGFINLELWACFSAEAVLSGATITVQMSSTIPTNSILVIRAAQVAYPNPAVDAASVISSGTGNVSFQSGTWSQTGELVIGIFNIPGGGNENIGVGWTALFGNKQVDILFQNVSGSGPTTFSINQSNGSSWVAGIVGFAQVVPSFPPRRLNYRRRH